MKYVLIFLVRVYQVTLSPLIPPSCRYEPTCSVYMVEAIKEWGVLEGTWLGLKRIGRCRPGGSCGYDPVPKKK